MGPGIFVYKMPCQPKLKWALDLFTRWPHYKMTHKNPFCSGLKATHFVWEIPLGDIFSSSWTQKKMHAKRPIWSTIWSTKSRTRKDQSGAWFGAQKVAREKTHLEHDLEHKKSHAKRPIWSTIWSTKSCTRKRPIWSTIWGTKSCTRKDPSRARFGAQKVAREKDPSGTRFEAQKVAREKTHLEHDLEH